MVAGRFSDGQKIGRWKKKGGRRERRKDKLFTEKAGAKKAHEKDKVGEEL